MFDIGFQAPLVARMFASGMNLKVFVLDTQGLFEHRRPSINGELH